MIGAALCLATAIYFEARSESPQGQADVAYVVLNRVDDRRWPNTICGVVQQKRRNVCQFSFYCDGESDVPRDGYAWDLAQVLAADILASGERSTAAVFYHADYVNPYWAKSFEFVGQTGAHLFYR